MMTMSKSSKRILVVDDYALIREMVCDLLQAEGYEVVEAENGDEALHLALAMDFDAVISDVDMPHMNGRELASRLAQVRPELPIVIMAGGGADGGIKSFCNPMVKTVLHKPARMSAIRDAVAEAIASAPCAALMPG